MRILVLCYEYPPVGGGGGRVAAQVAASLVQRGHEVRVITAGLRHLPRREVRDGVEIFRPESFRRREDTCSVFEMGLYLATSFLPAVKMARHWRPDVVHAHFAVPTGVLAWAVRAFSGAPYVLTAHLGDVPGGVPAQTDHLFHAIDSLIKPIWQDAQKITAVSEFVADLAAKAYEVDPVIIPNGVRMRGAAPLKPHQPSRILMVGRMSIQKNPLLALRALALVKDLPWTFEIIGEGPLAAETRSLARALYLEDRVEFHGWLAAEQVAAAMENSDILLMTSLQEGMPMVAIEALPHGLAIVASAIGGMKGIVEENVNGFLCPLAPEAFAEKLRLALSSPARLAALRQASLNKAPAFDLDQTIETYERVLLDARRPTR